MAGWVASDSIFTYWSTPRHPPTAEGGKPRSPPPQLPAAATATGPTTGLACACACLYKCASSPTFRTITVSTRCSSIRLNTGWTLYSTRAPVISKRTLWTIDCSLRIIVDNESCLIIAVWLLKAVGQTDLYSTFDNIFFRKSSKRYINLAQYLLYWHERPSIWISD